jgi:hypothetical protein
MRKPKGLSMSKNKDQNKADLLSATKKPLVKEFFDQEKSIVKYITDNLYVGVSEDFKISKVYESKNKNQHGYRINFYKSIGSGFVIIKNIYRSVYIKVMTDNEKMPVKFQIEKSDK